MWLFKLYFRSQSWHLLGFFFSCIAWMCISMALFCLKSFSQTWHLYGLISSWISLMCFLKVLLNENIFSQSLHLWVIPLWIADIWCVKLVLCAKSLLQKLQVCVFFLSWMDVMWYFKAPLDFDILSQRKYQIEVPHQQHFLIIW